MSRTFAYPAAALLVLGMAATIAPAASAEAARSCNGVTLLSNFTGACTVTDCYSSQSGNGIVVWVHGKERPCIGIDP